MKIHYEVVDLGEQDANGVGGSPIAFRDANGTPAYVYSERYVLLQTYVFKNVHETEDVNDLEFYQMLHGHPTGYYPLNAKTTYETTSFADPLAGYLPYDPNHQIGNFRYDMTQWNTVSPNPYYEPNHFDYMSFSSTVEPNYYGIDRFTGESSGLGYDMKNRTLNGYDYMQNSEMAGAMMWNLGSLEPNETTSITLALMYGVGPVHYCPYSLTITDDASFGCVEPFEPLIGNYLNYEICYDPCGIGDTNVVIIDELPADVNYYSCTAGGVYDSNSHSVIWDIGDLGPNDANCMSVSVEVKDTAQPGGVLTNTVTLEGDTYSISANKNTDICCYEGDTIYVDDDANTGGDGLSWDTAFDNLRDAIDEINNRDCYDKIYIAGGTYKPVESVNVPNYEEEFFELSGDMAIIGHFAGDEQGPAERDLSDPNCETILQGKIGEDYRDAVEFILKAEDADNILLDGLTVTGAYDGAGLQLDNSNASIINCKFTDNDEEGIDVIHQGEIDIHNSTFFNNNGIQGYYVTLNISSCIFDGNDRSNSGIYVDNDNNVNITDSIFRNYPGSTLKISDGTIYIAGSKIENSDSYGIYFSDECNTEVINSIFESNKYGMNCSGTGNFVIQNCIVRDSLYNAIYTRGDTDLNIEKCILNNSGKSGLYFYDYNSANIKDCWIYNNGTSQNQSYAAGIRFKYGNTPPQITNNTIYGNYSYGIEMDNDCCEPNVVNCIIRDNGTDDLYWENHTFPEVNYCCLQEVHSGTGNIVSDPCFINPSDVNDLHICENSACKDTGDPNGSYQWQTDIDGEDRIYYGRVDIGADEYYWSPADFDESGNVDFADYAILNTAWASVAGESDYNETCDIEDNNAIGAGDLKLFCEDWLWEKAWGDTGWMMAMNKGGEITFESSMTTFNSESVDEVSSTSDSDALMLDDLQQSLAKMPEKLKAKTRRFYDISPSRTVSSVRVKQAAVDEILKFLDKMRASGELDKSLTEQKYLEFRKAVEGFSKF